MADNHISVLENPGLEKPEDGRERSISSCEQEFEVS